MGAKQATLLIRYLVVLALTTATGLLAAERWYEVEVILFEQATEERQASESWTKMPPLPELNSSRDIQNQAPFQQTIDSVCVNNRWYQVNSRQIIEPVVPVSDESEILADVANVTTQSAEAIVTDTIEQPFQLLPAEARQLNELYQNLRRRRGYRMLFHEAWRQPMASKQNSQSIRLHAGKDYSAQFNYAGDAIVELANATQADDSTSELLNYLGQYQASLPATQIENPRFNQNQPIDPLMDMDNYFRKTRADMARDRVTACAEQDQQLEAEKRQPVWQIDGYINLYAERFRHLETNLVLRIPGQEEVDLRSLATSLAADEMISSINLDSSAPTTNQFDWQLDDNFLNPVDDPQLISREILKHYSLQQSRRIIDDRVHYFDHPLIGMIIQMRPYDPEAPDPT